MKDAVHQAPRITARSTRIQLKRSPSRCKRIVGGSRHATTRREAGAGRIRSEVSTGDRNGTSGQRSAGKTSNPQTKRSLRKRSSKCGVSQKRRARYIETSRLTETKPVSTSRSRTRTRKLTQDGEAVSRPPCKSEKPREESLRGRPSRKQWVLEPRRARERHRRRVRVEAHSPSRPCRRSRSRLRALAHFFSSISSPLSFFFLWQLRSECPGCPQ